jgi:hypothetical protein
MDNTIVSCIVWMASGESCCAKKLCTGSMALFSLLYQRQTSLEPLSKYARTRSFLIKVI